MSLFSPETVQLAVVVLVAIAVGGIAYALVAPLLAGGSVAEKRLANLSKEQSKRRVRSESDLIVTRKREVQQTLKDLEARQKSRKKTTLKLRLARAGFDLQPRSFYMASLGLGLGMAFFLLVTGISPLAAWKGSWVLRELMRGWQEQQEASAAPPLVRGEDVMARFHLPPGPAVGALLTRAREAQALGLVRTREEALRYLDSSGDET